MATSFDLIVIGTGTAASGIASGCRAAGWSVAVVDHEPFGGTCALRGCDPKKVLVGAADVIDWLRRMQGKGVDPGGARISWQELMRFKRTFTETFPRKREHSYERQGIVGIRGRARFLDQSRVLVGKTKYEARHFGIATGATPAPLDIPGEHLAMTSTDFLELDELPERLVFIGGGYIAFEFAHLAARAGAHATIVHRGSQALKGFDPDLVARLVAKSRAVGIDVQLNARVTAVEENGGGATVRAETTSGVRTFECDRAVHAAGRAPNIRDLGLDALGVTAGPKGVAVNEYLQSVSNPDVYAAGDVADTGNPGLTPVAAYEARIAAANLVHPGSTKLEPRAIPSVVFSIPPLATVGIQEAEARREGRRIRVVHEDTSTWYSSRRIGEDCSGTKVVIDEDTDRILGAHLLGPHAEEVINVFALAIEHGITAGRLRGMLFGYPTQVSDIEYIV